MGSRDQTAEPSPLRRLSALHVTVAAGAVLALYVAAGPINDRDLFWHVAVGREILSTRSIEDLTGWWLAVPGPPWQTSQWLSEVLIATIHESWGWSAFVVIRLAWLAGLLALVAVTLMRGRVSVSSTIVTLLVFFTLAVTTQDRPQSVSFLFLVILGTVCARLLESRRSPPLAGVAITCLAWAQFHPLWLLAPLSFGLLVLCFLVQDRAWDGPTMRACGLCVLASLCGLLNPVGLASLTLPLRFQQATDVIAEWRTTTLTEISTVAWGVVLLLTFLAWAKARTVPTSELVWVFSWTVFGLLAYRNVTPSLLMIAPVSVAALHRAAGPAGPRPRTSSVEARVLAGVLALTMVGGAAVLAGEVRRVDPLAETPARAIAAWVARQSSPVRVFNHYNVSGSLVSFSAGRARLAVDGRADMWGGTYIDEVVGVQNLEPGWEERLERFRPDAVVSDEQAALPQLLVREGGWRVEVRDGPFVLLTPTESAG